MHVCELKPHITRNSAYTFSSMDVCSCLEQHANYTSMSLATGDGERCGPILHARKRKAPTVSLHLRLKRCRLYQRQQLLTSVAA